METRRLGRSGLRVSEVGYGSWLTLGSSVTETRASERLVHRAVELGVNFFDTADVYARGAAEESLGRALRAIPRHQLVIATKCFFPMTEDPNDRGLSRKHIVESVEASLLRLGTDYLDLHQCHRPDPETPLEETVRAYDDLIRQGKVLYWGVSHWSEDDVRATADACDRLLAPRPISSQPAYSIVRRDIEKGLLAACREAGLGQVVFSPLAQGVLTGKYAGGAGSRASDERHNRWMGQYLEPGLLERIEALRPIARDAGLSLAQLALAWCLRRPEVASVLIGASRPEQLEENCAAAGRSVDLGIWQRIDALFPPP